MRRRKGIILAGGSGGRLYPLTIGVSKQLLPVYDKPMIFYPLSVLMLAGIQEILIITTPEDQALFRRVLDDGSQWGLQLSFKAQPNPDGLAQAFILAEDFLDGSPSALILGDNIFFGNGFSQLLAKANHRSSGATIFGYHVSDPERYGIAGFAADGGINSIIEKPSNPASSFAVTGLYFVDETAPERARNVKPSARGELEITCILNSYLEECELGFEKMGRGFAWLDTGTHDTLLDAGNFVRTLTERQGLQTGSPDEVAYQLKWINETQLRARAQKFGKNKIGEYLLSAIKPKGNN